MMMDRQSRRLTIDSQKPPHRRGRGDGGQVALILARFLVCSLLPGLPVQRTGGSIIQGLLTNMKLQE